MKIFKCGLCKEKNRIAMTRKGLRDHLAKEHFIVRDKANTSLERHGKKDKQKFWIMEEIK